MKHRSFFGLIVLFLAAGSIAADTDPAPRELIIAVKGEMDSEGVFTLLIEPGKFATKAIRIYSEPSHSLWVLLWDRDFRSSADGKLWRAKNADQIPLETAIGKLPETRPFLHVDPRPEEDTRIKVWINGDWPDGTTEDRLVADAWVGSGDFAFSGYFVDASAAGDKKGKSKIEWCCEGGDCEKTCTECTDVRFTCCVVKAPDCCWIECGKGRKCSCR